jgi:hypothetical protein
MTDSPPFLVILSHPPLKRLFNPLTICLPPFLDSSLSWLRYPRSVISEWSGPTYRRIIPVSSTGSVGLRSLISHKNSRFPPKTEWNKNRLCSGCYRNDSMYNDWVTRRACEPRSCICHMSQLWHVPRSSSSRPIIAHCNWMAHCMLHKLSIHNIHTLENDLACNPWL